MLITPINDYFLFFFSLFRAKIKKFIFPITYLYYFYWNYFENVVKETVFSIQQSREDIISVLLPLSKLCCMTGLYIKIVVS